MSAISTTMMALRAHARGGPEQLVYEQAPTRTPAIPSHEVSGTVVGLGPDAGGVAVRDKVYGLIDFDRNGAAAHRPAKRS